MPPAIPAKAAHNTSATALRRHVTPTGVHRPFGDDEIIVSKTNLKGHITYANSVFCRVSAFARAELMGAPQSVIRHPDMPRAIFQQLWDTVNEGREMFGYIINLASNGDHYWVFAHVTPSTNRGGQITGFHSNRRTVDKRKLPAVEAFYARLLAAEKAVENAGGLKRDAIAASSAIITQYLRDNSLSRDEFAWSF